MWRPAAAVVAGAALAIAAIWWIDVGFLAEVREFRVVLTGLVLLLSAIALAVWLVFYSRASARTRWMALGTAVAVVGIAALLFRYRGVTGDLVPQFEPRFAPAPGAGTATTGAELTGAGDYPQFLGVHRDGTVAGVDLARDWDARPPRIVWRRAVGPAWSGFAVSGAAAVTQEQHGEQERVSRYELVTGELRWSVDEPVRYANAVAGDGPRATPAIADGVVYAIGAKGILKAVDLETGRVLWRRDVTETQGAELPQYGASSSPLLTDGVVVVTAGGPAGRSLAAFDAETGRPAWSGGDDPASYASPFVATLAGVRQIVSRNQNSVTGHEIGSGRVLWRIEWTGSQPNAVQPLALPGDRLLVSSGWGRGAAVYDVSASQTGELELTRRWEAITLKPKFSNAVLHDGLVYGLDDGILVCVDPETGKRRWKRGRYGHGQLLLVEDTLLIQSEHGEVVLVEPDPTEHRELARFDLFDGKLWNPPALAGRYLLMRNDAEAVLLELPTR